MQDSKPESTNNQLEPKGIAAKLKQVLSPEELEYFLGNKGGVFDILEKKAEKEPEKIGQSVIIENQAEKTELSALIKDHLLLASYHVFQWFAFDVKRDTIGVDFGNPIKTESYDTTKVYPNIRLSILRSTSPEMGDRIEKHVNQLSKDRYHVRTFTRSNGEEVALGQVFVGKTEGREGRGLVLLEGAFSTESNSSRVGGRRNIDNEILWVFDSMGSASKFVSFFDNSRYIGDPTGVEHNEEVIEKSFEATGMDQRYINTMKARLFWGQEVLTVN